MRTTRQYGKEIDRALGMWVKLARAHDTMSALADRNIHGFGLTTPQFGALECLGHLGPMTIGTLCRKMLVSGGNMTVVVDNLEKEGLVERVRDTEDRRKISVRLTKKGEKLFRKIFIEHAKHITELASVLTPNEQDELAGLLKKMGTRLELKR
jgi:MarR family transcriptional regulator, 2-MHQ and catechol-resistance regulon repressor